MALVGVPLSAAYYSGAPVAAQTTAAKPNFVFILADDMRYDDFSYMPKTRNLISSQGMTFSKAYVPLSTCCLSRVSILTGMYKANRLSLLSVCGL
jgi:N-acetylglucosamine-6-sulfatase